MIQIDNVSFGYNSDAELFSDLSLEVKPGNIYGLLGKNGAGKTSLLKLMAGLLYTQKGSIKYNNTDVSLRQPKVLSDIFIIPEEFFIPDMSIKSYISHFSGFYPHFDQKIMDDIVSEFEIETNRNINRMSYGQKKKFLIAFAIASNCPLVLMDEPTNGLDIPSKSKFRKVIASHTTDERTFFISTHQVRDLENLIDPVVIIEKGKIIFNYSMDLISGSLDFKKSNHSPSADLKVFHKEPVFGGEVFVTEKLERSESPVDIELLFNAVLSNTSGITEHLNNA